MIYNALIANPAKKFACLLIPTIIPMPRWLKPVRCRNRFSGFILVGEALSSHQPNH
jgi:hypothetical protein